MDQRQQDRLFMMKAVRDTNKAAKTTWENMKPFKNLNDELTTVIDEIDQAAQGQQITSTGITQDKQSLTTIAVNKVLQIARNASVYALQINNNDLFAQLNVNKFYLLNLPDNEQAAALKAVFTAVEPFVNELEDYMITAEVIDDAKAAVSQSELILTKPRTTIVTRTTATASVSALLNKGRLILAKMDRLIHNFMETNPVFVSNYKGARIIIDRG